MILKVFLHIFYNLDPSKARFFFAPASGARDALVSILEGYAHKHCIRDVTMHTSVTSDEVKYTPYVSCARHIDAYGHLAQKVQLKSNIFKVFVYELKRKYVYRFVRNCCSVLVFGVRNNSIVGGESGPLQQLVVALLKSAHQ